MAVSIKNHDNKRSINKAKDEVRRLMESEDVILKVIPMCEITVDNLQPRKSFINIAELAESIKSVGLIQPIILNRTQDGYKIIAGERRYRAFLQLKKDKIPAIIKNESDEIKIDLIQILENEDRDELAPLEEADAIQKMVDKHDLSIRSLAEQLGKSKDWVYLRSSLAKSPDDIREIASTGICKDLKTLQSLKTLWDTDKDSYNKCYSKLVSGEVKNMRKYIMDFKSRKTYSSKEKSYVIKSINRSGNELMLELSDNKIITYLLDDSCNINV
jgi:ParB family chromosome partitioning protein